MGDRLQVPARAGRDRDRGHRSVCRPNGHADAGRPHASGQGRRLDGRARNAPQPRRGAPQGHPDRRSRDPPEGRRRDPGGRQAAAREADRGRARIPDARRVPGLRHARCSRRRRRSALLPEPGVSGARRAGVRPLRRPRRYGHRGRRLGCADPAAPARDGQAARGLLPAQRR